ncbi:MAG: helix-turn-helix transcriptional regulator [Clostridia bacterium]|nr:helix-turn-helix transcriptional regulator [Clostridia bacterium]
MKINKLVSLRMKELLKARNWTQYQLAQRSALPLSTLSHIMRCKSHTVTLESILNICRGFDIRLVDFFNDAQFEIENISDDD